MLFCFALVRTIRGPKGTIKGPSGDLKGDFNDRKSVLNFPGGPVLKFHCWVTNPGWTFGAHRDTLG